MHDRVEFLHGRFSIRSAPGEGTAVEAEIPLREEDSAG
jgi:signal transduction histidine kinase